MIELFEQQLKGNDRSSSKGNQLKWEDAGIWYKADENGYEGLAEYVVSQLLKLSSLKTEEYVCYELEKIKYRHQIFTGAKSKDFLDKDWQIITFERLFYNNYHQSLYKAIWKIKDTNERFDFLVNTAKRMTGLEEIGVYLAKLTTLDALFKNEDRHMHNIAVLMNSKGEFRLCPIFDNGASLLSDTKIDYPMGEDTYKLMDEVKAKTFSRDFDEQLDVVEKVYGEAIHFSFTKKDVDNILNSADIYSKEEKARVKIVLYEQMRKYKYLF